MHRVHIIALSIGALALAIIGVVIWHHHRSHPADPSPSAVIDHIPLQSIVEEHAAYLPVDSPGEARIDPQKVVDAIANFQKVNPAVTITSSDVIAHGVVITWECKCRIP
jgi:hypothetical protein